jgi:hypothetical protein
MSDSQEEEDHQEQINSANDNERRNIPRKIFSRCGEEVLYGITFLGRLIMTLYSFHGLFFIYNFIVQFIILVPGILYEIQSTVLQIILSLVYILFALFSSNLLIIPTYDLILFPFLRYRNVIAHLESLAVIKNIIDDDNETKKELDTERNRDWLDILLIVLEIFYFLGFCLEFTSYTKIITDIIHVFVLFVIYLYQLVLFFSYIIICLYLMLKIGCNSDRCCGCGYYEWFIKLFIDLGNNLNTFFNDKKPLPKINLLCYVINPVLQKSYQSNNLNLKIAGCNKWFVAAKKFGKLICFVGSFILAAVVLFKKDVLSILFFLIFYIFMFILSSMISFPFIIRNKYTLSFGDFWLPNEKYKQDYKLEHPRIIAIIRIICFFIVLLTSIALCGSFFYFNEKNSLTEISQLSFTSSSDNSNTENLLLPNLCSSTIYNMPIYLYMPFINDAYYYDDNSALKSSFGISGYKNLFFDNTVTIDPVGNIIKSKSTDEEQVKMIQYNVKYGDKEINIFSIKGTSHKKDLFLDMQLYFPSVLLNLLTTFSLFGQQKDTYYFHFMEYGLSIPYRIFSQYLIVDGYLCDLLNAYQTKQEELKSQNKELKNVVIVGHSLGGGLCKLLGRLLKKPAISLSGPGVNAFHSLWGYAGKSENFEISAIDLVPDMDLVPRVEISGGSRYRIICKEGPFDCHGKALSLCEVLIMCRSPNYEEYCKKMVGLNDYQIKTILASSELNNDDK